ncbi:MULTISPECIES: LysR family transcriptional regulator [unclassified Oceanobacter]|uniref:LysR family transcriptional regulator n=1 Tax=unclassified Oceanobacter TaxID=2620260 RepID=UPI0026E2833B|nr:MULTISPECIES: LysR family transcriptional regulator [unclassified Oceanobacter]MDO6681909.1 LysR family transcriptional regulator [Oceanobacter sp. 5_MG-2023]MDP2505271.1 LysR family transcriptional regulator [Oceanobacter sp. 3_MG-2023]MDP2607904.1 LysR family transcriptional regulator [Oceanobacter sp. 1_MG-2023]MDP2611434.1 LysR family transcriptional regulator [Oceanobacter sp. 2_MG-2023]
MDFVIPNLRHLRVFLEVAEQKSISKAAPRVFLSQPAITQALARLENMLQTGLFDRRAEGMYPTASGEVWYNRVERCIACLLQGTREALRSGSRTQSAQQMVSLLTTTQLKALVAVTEAENFSIASRAVGVSQSSLHRAARELEHLLQVPLFEKTSTGISATKAAQALARATKLAFSELYQGYSEVSALQFREVGKIVLGSMPLARTSILPEAIIRFSERHPDIDIQVVDAPYDDLLHHLRHGDLDFLIGALRFPPPVDDVVQEELLSPPLAIICRPEHPLLVAATSTSSPELTDLTHYPWIVPRNGTPTRKAFETLFAQCDIQPPQRLVESSSQILTRELLRGSDRLTLISTHQIEQELNSGLLSVLPVNLEDTRRAIGITLRQNWQPTPSQMQFLDILREQAAACRDQ